LQILLHPLTLAYSALLVLRQLLYLQHLAMLRQKYPQQWKELAEFRVQLLMRTLLLHHPASLQ
jgi:hypothetical protein